MVSSSVIIPLWLVYLFSPSLSLTLLLVYCSTEQPDPKPNLFFSGAWDKTQSEAQIFFSELFGIWLGLGAALGGRRAGTPGEHRHHHQHHHHNNHNHHLHPHHHLHHYHHLTTRVTRSGSMSSRTPPRAPTVTSPRSGGRWVLVTLSLYLSKCESNLSEGEFHKVNCWGGKISKFETPSATSPRSEGGWV